MAFTMDAPPVRYVTTSDGVSLAYAIVGDGLPLIHLPMIFSHFSQWWGTGLRRVEFEALAERFQLLLYDGRGQGMSTRGVPSELPVESLDADLETVAALVSAPRFLLLTVSSHGLLAIRYVVRHPERVAGLVLWNYIDTKMASYAPAFRALAEADWETHLASQVFMNHPHSEPALVTRVMRASLSQSELIAMTGALRSTTAEGLLGQLRVPVLVLASRTGERARPNEEAGRWLAARIPKAELVLLDGSRGGWDPVDGVPPVVLAIEEFARALPDQSVSPIGTSTTGAGLSGREVEVLRLVAAGKSNQQIANELVISLNTVRRHVSNVFDKMGVANRAEAASYAHQNHLV
jgi:DNA-binding CsgD family transcriptional regulator/pimeloyl-ACP methyl ester carboxylesterase